MATSLPDFGPQVMGPLAGGPMRGFVSSEGGRRVRPGLARKIEDVGPEPRKATQSIAGDGDRVPVPEGDIDGKEGERLAAGLEADRSKLGFERGEGRNGPNEWWSRV